MTNPCSDHIKIFKKKKKTQKKKIIKKEKAKDDTFSDAAGGKATTGAAALLKMEASSSAPHTERVGLVSPLTEASCSFSLSMFNHANYIAYIDCIVYFNFFNMSNS